MQGKAAQVLAPLVIIIPVMRIVAIGTVDIRMMVMRTLAIAMWEIKIAAMEILVMKILVI